jgi:hypothetical protein
MTPLALWAPKNYTPEVRNVGFIYLYLPLSTFIYLYWNGSRKGVWRGF